MTQIVNNQNKLIDLLFSKFSISIFLIALLTQMFLPWWTIALVAAVLAFVFAKSAGEAFMKGLVMAFLLWLITACYYHFSTDGILSNKIAQILPVNGRTSVLIVLTALIGGLVTAWGAMSGYLFRQIFKG